MKDTEITDEIQWLGNIWHLTSFIYDEQAVWTAFHDHWKAVQIFALQIYFKIVGAYIILRYRSESPAINFSWNKNYEKQ